MTKKHQRLLASILFLAAAMGTKTAEAGLAYNPGAVLIIDEAADLDHVRLTKSVLRNKTELEGLENNDDDCNEFVDDVAGWNNVSNDAQYMPTYLKKWFLENAVVIREKLELFSRTILGDKAALEEIQSNPYVQSFIKYLTEKSHGTHVSGIVAKGGQGAALVQSMNVFTGSADPGMPSSAEEASLQKNKGSTQDLLRRIRERSYPQPAKDTEEDSFRSSFDNREAIEAEILEYKKERAAEMDIISRFLFAHGHGVSNLSLGTSRTMIWGGLEQQWDKELEEQTMKWNTPRTKTQEANFQYLANAIYDTAVEGWHKLFRDHKNVLFVVAAGNDGQDISIWEHECTPAEAGATIKNVLTVAATDADGTITDFSNFGKQHVAMAARGQAVRSLAPGDMEVVMDGTSMASPFVAALAARVRTINPKLSAVEVRMLLENTGHHVNSLEGKVRNSSIIDPEAALAAAESSKTLGGMNIEVIAAEKNSRKKLFLKRLPLEGFKYGSLQDFEDRTLLGSIARTPDIVKKILFGRNY